MNNTPESLLASITTANTNQQNQQLNKLDAENTKCSLVTLELSHNKRTRFIGLISTTFTKKPDPQILAHRRLRCWPRCASCWTRAPNERFEYVENPLNRTLR